MKQKPDSVFREARSMGFDAKASAVLAKAVKQPATPPSLAEFGEQIADKCMLVKGRRRDGLMFYEIREGYPSSAELASLVLSMVDAFRASQRGADEPAESAHR
jgi:hypothetical protein